MINLTKQKLAQKRNYFKFVLTGIYKPIDKQALTEEELRLWNELLTIKDKLKDNFEANSRIKRFKCTLL